MYPRASSFFIQTAVRYLSAKVERVTCGLSGTAEAESELEGLKVVVEWHFKCHANCTHWLYKIISDIHLHQSRHSSPGVPFLERAGMLSVYRLFLVETGRNGLTRDFVAFQRASCYVGVSVIRPTHLSIVFEMYAMSSLK